MDVKARAWARYSTELRPFSFVEILLALYQWTYSKVLLPRCGVEEADAVE